MPKKPLLCTLLLLAVLLAPCAMADVAVTADTDAWMDAAAPMDSMNIPALDDYMARLAILAQRDERLAGVVYAESTLKERGCGPMSVTNAVVGCLGVQDEAQAVSMAQEMTQLLVRRERRGRGYMHISLLESALDPEARQAQKEDFPTMAAVMGSFPGVVSYTDGKINERRLKAAARLGKTKLFIGRAYIQENWDYIISLVRMLHEAGRDDIVLYLAQCDAGKKRHGTPLRYGDSGHYLSLAVPVGALWNDGLLYVLDSLPRAIQGEEVSSESVYHVRYPFVDQNTVNDKRFRSVFCASRVSPTVIRLSPTQEERSRLAQAHAAGADETQAQLERQMTPLFLFGGCTLLVNTGGITQ